MLSLKQISLHFLIQDKEDQKIERLSFKCPLAKQNKQLDVRKHKSSVGGMHLKPANFCIITTQELQEIRKKNSLRKVRKIFLSKRKLFIEGKQKFPTPQVGVEKNERELYGHAHLFPQQRTRDIHSITATKTPAPENWTYVYRKIYMHNHSNDKVKLHYYMQI